jgi:hypothetical protein
LTKTVLGSVVETIVGQQTLLRDFIPVFLTDSVDFEVFRRHGFVWEYFPDAEERARYDGTLSWAAYGAVRRELLRRKWGLDEVVAIGAVPFALAGTEAAQIAPPVESDGGGVAPTAPGDYGSSLK